MNSTDAGANWPNLPAEIWLNLLQYLNWDGLKSLRQTCRWFYDLCKRSFYKKKQFVFYGNINITAEIISLVDWECTAQNLKFVDAHLADVPILCFFRSQGANVRSLVFHNCQLSPGLLRKIILYCENLRSFLFEIDRNMKTEGDLESIHRDFKDLRKDRIIRQHVSSFSFFWEADSFVTYELLSYFFAVFPNITELRFLCLCTTADDAPVIDWALYISFTEDQLRKMSHRLEKLLLNFVWNGTEIISLDLIANIKMESLKTLSMRWFDNSNSSILTHPHLLAHLTEFDCLISDRLFASVAAFIQNLLKSAPKLRFLSVLKYNTSTFQYPDTTLDKDCFQALVNSRLRYLNIDVFSETDVIPYSLEDQLEPNYTLRILLFGSLPYSEDRVFLLFMKYFHNLDTISIKNNCKRVLYHVLVYQNDLRKLSLHHSSTENTEFSLWLSGLDKSYRRFDNLTCLCLFECSSTNFCELFLMNFEFPKLKSLAMYLEKDYCSRVNDNMCQILQRIRKLTQLEYLEIYWEIERTPLSLLDLCKNLPKLRYLIYSNNCYVPFDELEYHCIFEECPTLCIFIHRIEQDVYHRYVGGFNRSEKIGYEIVSPYSQICKGIPTKYSPYHWNTYAPVPAPVAHS